MELKKTIDPSIEIAKGFGWFTIGAIAHALHAFAPIHEIGHVIISWICGVDARLTGWMTSFHGRYLVANVYGGYYFEFAAWAFITLILRRRRIAFFPFAGMCYIGLTAPFSDDFNKYAALLGLPEILVPAKIFWSFFALFAVLAFYVILRRNRD